MHPSSQQTPQVPPATIANLLLRAASDFKNTVAVRYKRDGTWHSRTFGEVGEIVDEIALGLLSQGIDRGDRVCILCTTRPEWTYVDFAITRLGAIAVPIYPTNSPEECEWIASDSQAKVVICENEDQVQKLRQVRDRLSELELLIVIDSPTPQTDVKSLEEIRQSGKALDRSALNKRTEQITPQDIYTIIYTSGTTGPPKGCLLSHRNYNAMVANAADAAVLRGDGATYLYLPLAHSFALLAQLLTFELGGTLAYFGGDTKQIITELTEVKPTYLPSVPRIFEKIYTLAQAVSQQGPPEDQELFRKAIKVGIEVRERMRSGQPIPDELQADFDRAQEKLYNNVQALFGGNLAYAITGAAPITRDILEFFYACGVLVLEGYGLTETSTAATINRPDAFKFGTVGLPLPGVEVKIDEDGEVLIKGENIFEGYYNNEKETSAVLVNSWLRTGDIGEIDKEGFLTITGRKKDIIITAGGKNLTPANLENDLKQSRWVSQAVMYGDRRPYPVILITLDEEEMIQFAGENNLPQDLTALVKEPKVHELIQSVIDDVNQHYAQVEQVKKFVILDHDLTQETGELTPTLKVKRNVVYDKYADMFEALYQ
jgi:long-chain acyl-CoA synthetase